MEKVTNVFDKGVVCLQLPKDLVSEFSTYDGVSHDREYTSGYVSCNKIFFPYKDKNKFTIRAYFDPKLSKEENSALLKHLSFKNKAFKNGTNKHLGDENHNLTKVSMQPFFNHMKFLRAKYDYKAILSTVLRIVYSAVSDCSYAKFNSFKAVNDFLESYKFSIKGLARLMGFYAPTEIPSSSKREYSYDEVVILCFKGLNIPCAVCANVPLVNVISTTMSDDPFKLYDKHEICDDFVISIVDSGCFTNEAKTFDKICHGEDAEHYTIWLKSIFGNKIHQANPKTYYDYVYTKVSRYMEKRSGKYKWFLTYHADNWEFDHLHYKLFIDKETVDINICGSDYAVYPSMLQFGSKSLMTLSRLSKAACDNKYTLSGRPPLCMPLKVVKTAARRTPRVSRTVQQTYECLINTAMIVHCVQGLPKKFFTIYHSLTYKEGKDYCVSMSYENLFELWFKYRYLFFTNSFVYRLIKTCSLAGRMPIILRGNLELESLKCPDHCIIIDGDVYGEDDLVALSSKPLDLGYASGKLEESVISINDDLRCKHISKKDIISPKKESTLWSDIQEEEVASRKMIVKNDVIKSSDNVDLSDDDKSKHIDAFKSAINSLTTNGNISVEAEEIIKILTEVLDDKSG